MRRALSFLLFAWALPALADITVSTVIPSAGVISGGTIVHLHGTNLLGAPLACPSLQCGVYMLFGGTLGTVISDSGGEIVVVAPPHAAGAVDLVVNVPVSPLLTLTNAFIYQDPKSDSVRLLLPIAAGTQGLLNTSWQTDIFAHNETPSAVDVAGTTVPPASTKRLTLAPASTGMFLQIPRGVADGVTITTHVHDTTHDAESLGVDVPTVPETQFRRAVVLPGVPNDGRYRLLLRVYGYPGNYPIAVRVRNDSTGELLSQQDLTLIGSDLAYMQLPISGPSTSPILRVEVAGVRSFDPPIWAFLTLTNNTTENVTAITPNVVIAPESPSPVLAPGNWRHAGNCMTVTSTGGVNVSYGGCAFGTFTIPIVDADGHFEADGSLAFGGAFRPPEAAHFSGLVTNGILALTIRTPSQTIGPFTLIDGSTEPCGPVCP